MPGDRDRKHFELCCRGRVVRFPRRPLIMGIVNINDDSFSGDGTLDVEEALEIARTMVTQGADIIDVGAESARTNRAAIPVAEELRRLRPFVENFPHAMKTAAGADQDQLSPPLLSINTWRPEVARVILPIGGDILNDMGGLPDDTNARICAQYSAALLIMHSVGAPKEPHTHVPWNDPITALSDFFERKLALVKKAKLPDNQIIIDPGIDFAKQRDANLQIYAGLEALTRFARPILVPVSRKTVIGEVLGIDIPGLRDPGTIACLVASMVRGAVIFRVHNVAATAHTVKILQRIGGELYDEHH